jgi:hypothetical protein
MHEKGYACPVRVARNSSTSLAVSPLSSATVRPLGADLVPASSWWQLVKGNRALSAVLLRDALIALSWSNLCFLRIWDTLLSYSTPSTFWMKSLPARAEYTAAFVNVLFTAAISWLLFALRRTGRLHRFSRFSPLASLVALLLGLNSIREVVSRQFDLPVLRFGLFTALGKNGFILLVACLIPLGLFVIWRWYLPMVRAGAICCLILSPLIPVVFSQALARVTAEPGGALAGRQLAGFLGRSAPTRRVVWVIFDEWDYHENFGDRPGRPAMPELERLRRQSLTAANAYPPANGTALSLPALLSGRMVEDIRPQDAGTLVIRYRGDGEEQSWGWQRNIFDRAREAGYDGGIVGWYLPYCRVLAGSLSQCYWEDLAQQYNSMGARFPLILRNQLRSLLESNLLSPFGQSLATFRHRTQHERLVEEARRAVADPRLGLVLVHLPTTHVPYFHDGKTHLPTLSNSLTAGYQDSLDLLDRTAGQLRQSMEQAGLWPRTTLLLSSDHWFRNSERQGGARDERIPFVLHLAGQEKPVAYGRTFNSVLTSDLLLNVLDGRLASGEQTAAWLDRQHQDRTRPVVRQGVE